MTIADAYRRTRDAAAAIAADATEQPQIRAAMRATAANNERLLAGCTRPAVLDHGMTAAEAAARGARLPRGTVCVSFGGGK